MTVARLARALLASLVALLVAVVSSSAFAEGKTIAIVIEGNNADSVRSKIVTIAPKGLTIGDSSTFDAALGKAGQKHPLAKSIENPKGRDKLLKATRKALETTKMDGALLGRTKKVKGADEVYLIYVDAIPGDLAVDEAVPLAAGKESDALKKTLGNLFDQLAPPPPKKEEPKEEPKVVEPPPPPPEEKSERPAHNVSTELFEVRAGFELGGRNFEYKDALPQNVSKMRLYHLFGAALLAVGADVYPAAGTGVKVAKDLGVQFDFAHAFALNSAVKGGEPFSTSYTHMRLALRGRFRTGDENSPVLGARFGYALTSFNFSPPPSLEGTLADVSYGCLMLGVDGRIPIGRLAFNLGFDYLAPLSKGQVYDRFKGSSIGAIDLRAGFGIAIAAGLEARFTADYGRYFYSFKPVPGDTYVAGGALDQLLGLTFGAAYVY